MLSMHLPAILTVSLCKSQRSPLPAPNLVLFQIPILHSDMIHLERLNLPSFLLYRFAWAAPRVHDPKDPMIPKIPKIFIAINLCAPHTFDHDPSHDRL